VLDDHGPVKYKKSQGKLKFIAPDIEKAIRVRNAVKRKYNKSRTPKTARPTGSCVSLFNNAKKIGDS